MGLNFTSVYLFVVFLNFIFTNRYHFCHNKITQQIVFNNIKLRFIYSRQGIGRDFFWGVLEKRIESKNNDVGGFQRRQLARSPLTVSLTWMEKMLHSCNKNNML